MKVLLLAIAAAAAAAGCILPEPPALTRFEFTESHMATPCEIKLYAADAGTAQAAAREAYAEIAAIDLSMNDWKPDSEISRLSAASGGPAVAVSDRLFEVLEASHRISEFSEGAFDITVGPVVKLWRRIKKDSRMASPEELQAALSAVGYRHVALDPSRRTVRLDRPGMSLDVGGIAKGYACDRALAILARHGITRALVNTGGGMAFGDPPPGQPGWKIGLADTDQVLSLSRCGVATSGDWERFVVIDGQRYSHVVDPRTGLGLTNRALVTVVAPTGMDADGLTKTVMVRGAPAGLAALNALPGTQAWLRWEDGGRTRIERTPGFDRLLLSD
jgi:thiamine biosynthesis lipoprotein